MLFLSPVGDYYTYVADTLLSHFPELSPQLRRPELRDSLPGLLDLFAAYTRQALTEGSLTTLKQCLLVADLLRGHDDYLAAAVRVGYLRRLRFDDTAYAAQLAHLLMPRPLYVAFCHYQ